jgi:ElaB/YqjD/DUF883 family membrane-anchored ribosome-binding protein
VGEGPGSDRAQVMTMADEILAERTEVAAARAEALAARAALDDEIDRLEASARAAVDIPAKIRRNPVRTVGAAAGAGFLLVGGPMKVLRRARNAVFGKPDPLPRSMLPREIDKAISELGDDGARVRGTIEREFAAYLKEKAPERRERDLPGVTASLLSQLGRPVVQRAGRRLAEELLSPRESSFADQLARVRGRRADGGSGPADPGGEG